MTTAELVGSGPATGTSALAIRGLRKSFGPNLAVRDVDLAVAPGTFLGLVGPNGAGKTTLLSMAVGLPRPGRRLGSREPGLPRHRARGRPGQSVAGRPARRARPAAPADRTGTAPLP